MRLVSVEIENYKRFITRNRINLDSDVVAIVGPNEAGKSSLLQALSHLNNDEPFDYKELSRGTTPAPNLEILSARFLLEQQDYELIRDIPGSALIRWLVITKRRDGSQDFGVEPAPVRDKRPRQRIVDVMARLNRSKWRGHLENDPETSGIGLLDDVISRLNTHVETLPGEDAAAIGAWAADLDRLFQIATPPAYASDLPARLRDLEPLERQEAPGAAAARKLWDASPLVLFFSDDERTLSSEYDLEDVAGDPPPALLNLANLAELDLENLLATISAEDFGQANTLIARANSNLDAIFREAWQQSEVSVNFGRDGTLLRLFARNAKGGNYTSIAERSDGMRAFVALVAFVATEAEGHRPILLIDEAETHLHYDAQADLVRMFTKQEAASQVIYTTHSAGCLPQDLGTGVRLVIQVDEDSSKMVDHFWAEGPGFTPLLIGMGASSLAFTPTRFAVIAEGPTEVVLLPTLIREATGLDDIGFQVAPGLASAAPSTISDLEFEAVRVGYLVDADAGGRAIRKKLTGEGVPAQRIVTLGAQRSDLTIEDFVRPEMYLRAVNEELWRSHGGSVEMPRSALARRRNAKAVAAWCATQAINPPNKVSVAYRLLELRRAGSLLDPRKKTALRAVHRTIARALGIKLPRATR